MTYEGQIAESVRFTGYDGDDVDGYYARPLGPGPSPGVVIIHHAPGLDEETMDVVRRLAAHGYAAVAPHLYTREAAGTDSATAGRIVRASGGLPDGQMTGDMHGGVTWLRRQPYASGKVGILGMAASNDAWRRIFAFLDQHLAMPR